MQHLKCNTRAVHLIYSGTDKVGYYWQAVCNTTRDGINMANCASTVHLTLRCHTIFKIFFFTYRYFGTETYMIYVIVFLCTQYQMNSWIRTQMDPHCKIRSLLANVMYIVFCRIQLKFIFWVHKKSWHITCSFSSK